jgi:glycine/D-amino acid oxidase-like deaminating enzyme
VQAIASLVKNESIDCDFTPTKSFDVFTETEKASAAEKAYLELKKAGVAKTTMDDLVWTRAEDAEKSSGVKRCVGCFSFTAAHLWPYKLMMHLLSLAASCGLNLQTHTPVTTFSTPSTPGSWTVYSPRGTITAKKLIFATNGYTSALLPEYANKIVPCRGICSRIVVPPNSIQPSLTSSYGLRLGNSAGDYLIPRPDGSIIVGGARSTFFKTHRSEWHNVLDDSTLIAPAAQYFENYMQTNFHGWENSGAKVDRVWTGIMGYNSDGLPSIGEVPGRQGCLIAAGFEGHGMPVIYLAMKGIAEMAGKGKKFEESGIPRIYKTTMERLMSERNDLAPLKSG